MKKIRHTTTLYYYDGPQVFEAKDGIGGHYVGVMVPPEEGQDRFILVGVPPERLRQFRTGNIDLRSLLTDECEGQWFLATTDGDFDRPFLLFPQSISLAESGFLPDHGFLLHERPADESALEEARQRNNLVLEVAVEPPESAEEHRIRVSTLVGLLDHLQTMVKHAYGMALRDLSPDARRTINRSDAHLMDVVIPAAAGSFRMILEASQNMDLLGHNELNRALRRVDDLFENVGDPKKTLDKVKEQKGHFAGAYLRLLKFLVQHKTGLRYAWAEPTFSSSKRNSISEAEAKPLVEVLSGVSNLSEESVSLVGILEKADVTHRTWRIATENGNFSGKTKEDGPSLQGMRIGGSYRLSCLEQIEETESIGRESRILYLTEYEPT